MSLSVTFLMRVMKSSSIRTLQNTITNSAARLDRLYKLSVPDPVAEQNELNRIDAAAQLLLSRGAPIYRDWPTPGGVSHASSHGVATTTGVTSAPWIKPAAFVLLGVYLYRKFL